MIWALRVSGLLRDGPNLSSPSYSLGQTIRTELRPRMATFPEYGTYRMIRLYADEFYESTPRRRPKGGGVFSSASFLHFGT